jgi:hypothetical protein
MGSGLLIYYAMTRPLLKADANACDRWGKVNEFSD